MTDTVDPRLIREHHIHGDTYAHPAYGMIGARRCYGGSSHLFGSDIVHRAFVDVTIQEAQLHRTLGQDWPQATKELVRIRLSEAQWATFVSSLNVGDGVPCTLDRVGGVRRAGIPPRREADVFRAEERTRHREMATRVRDALVFVETELKGVAKKKVKRVTDVLYNIAMDLDENEAYRQRTFEEHMETTVEKAKIEVNAYVTQALQRVGLDAIATGTVPIELANPTKEVIDE